MCLHEPFQNQSHPHSQMFDYIIIAKMKHYKVAKKFKTIITLWCSEVMISQSLPAPCSAVSSPEGCLDLAQAHQRTCACLHSLPRYPAQAVW